MLNVSLQECHKAVFNLKSVSQVKLYWPKEFCVQGNLNNNCAASFPKDITEEPGISKLSYKYPKEFCVQGNLSNDCAASFPKDITEEPDISKLSYKYNSTDLDVKPLTDA